MWKWLKKGSYLWEHCEIQYIALPTSFTCGVLILVLILFFFPAQSNVSALVLADVKMVNEPTPLVKNKSCAS